MAQRVEVPGMGVVEFPDGMSDDDISAAIRRNMGPKPSGLQQFLGNLGAGAVRGAGSIGATALAPLDWAAQKLGISNDFIGRIDRREAMDDALKSFGADPSSAAYGGGKLAAEVAGTLGVGGALGRAAAPMLGQGVGQALSTAGFSTGAVPATMAARAGDVAMRSGAGALTGAASAGLVNPDDAGLGAMVGGALPGAMGTAGLAGKWAGDKLRGTITPEVAALAKKAEELGVQIPADRLMQSKPMDAIASGLNYVPFSGRAATEGRMSEQLNQAASRTFGQDSSNVTQALRKADSVLGDKFDSFLRTNSVRVDQALMADLADAATQAGKELGADGASIIQKQIDEIITKGADGVIDGQAAYNIKKTLDRIGKRNSPEAWYALDLKQKLMGALNRSVGPDEAQAFKTLRQQYGNMIELQKLAKNGAEGEVSVARLANMKNINNAPLQDIADIAAQFVKPREGQHGAMQRAVVGLGAGMAGGPLGLLGTAAGGRSINALLNSNVARRGLLGETTGLPLDEFGLLGYRSAPVLMGDQ